MRKLSLLTSILLLAAGVSAQQAEKFVLLEHFTNACCGPCAVHNPVFQTNILENPAVSAKVHHISYHPWWPCDWDPMYTHNISENTSRTTFYSVGGVPDIIMQGTVEVGLPSAVTTTMINNEFASGSDISVIVDLSFFSADSGAIAVEVNTVGAQPSGNFRLRVAIVESLLTYVTPPGTNGETEFPNVFRKFIANNGSLPDYIGDKYYPASTGDKVTFNYRFGINPAWDPTKIFVVAFVQESDKTVLNSGSSLDAKASGVAETAPSFEGAFYPNPSSDRAAVRLTPGLKDASFQLVDIFGRVVFESPVPDGSIRFEVPSSTVPAGVYLGRLNKGNKSSAIPLVVIH